MDKTPMWNSILQWSLRQVDGTRPSQFHAMSKEDKEFLEKVFKSITIDPIARMKYLVAILKVPDNAPPNALAELEKMELASRNQEEEEDLKKDKNTEIEEKKFTQADLVKLIHQKKEIALEELDEHVIQIDLAVDLFKIGGLAVIISLLSNKSTSLQTKAAQVLATVVQNNPKAQEYALQLKALESLLYNLKRSKDTGVLNKCLFAVSGLIRSNKKAEEVFVKADGYSVLTQLMTAHDLDTRVQKKALFLLRHVWQNKNYRKLPKKSKLLVALVSFIGNEDIDLRESTLHSLIQLAEDSPSNLAQFNNPKLNLAQILNERLKTVNKIEDQEEKERHEDEAALLRQILQLLTPQ